MSDPGIVKCHEFSKREDYESPYQSILVKVFLLDNSVLPHFFLNNGVGMCQLMHGKHIQCTLVQQEKGRETQTHRITESQNCRGWKGPPEIIESNPAAKQPPTAGYTGRHPGRSWISAEESNSPEAEINR